MRNAGLERVSDLRKLLTVCRVQNRESGIQNPSHCAPPAALHKGPERQGLSQGRLTARSILAGCFGRRTGSGVCVSRLVCVLRGAMVGL
jgi:hypothetical protein